MARQILLISPREPSGATWLINCLLELGIKTYRYSPIGMWHGTEDGQYVLSEHEHILNKWLPALGNRQRFRFRDDIEVRWAHEWPTKADLDKQIVFFVRDPRDAIYSRYKREAPQQSFEEFVRFPDPYTLLNKADNWSLYTRSWLAFPDVQVVKFEDYKLDATATLRVVLNRIGVTATDAEIGTAVENSTQRKAAAAEERYRSQNPQDTQIINRSGSHGEWMKLGAEQEVFSYIEERTRGLHSQLGYGAADPLPAERFRPNTELLSFFRSVQLPSSTRIVSGDKKSAVNAGFLEVLRFIYELDSASLQRAMLMEHEMLQLERSIQEFLQALGCRSKTSFPSLVSAGPTSIFAAVRTQARSLRHRVAGVLRRIRRRLAAT